MASWVVKIKPPGDRRGPQGTADFSPFHLPGFQTATWVKTRGPSLTGLAREGEVLSGAPGAHGGNAPRGVGGGRMRSPSKNPARPVDVGLPVVPLYRFFLFGGEGFQLFGGFGFRTLIVTSRLEDLVVVQQDWSKRMNVDPG